MSLWVCKKCGSLVPYSAVFEGGPYECKVSGNCSFEFWAGPESDQPKPGCILATSNNPLNVLFTDHSTQPEETE